MSATAVCAGCGKSLSSERFQLLISASGQLVAHDTDACLALVEKRTGEKFIAPLRLKGTS